MNILCTNDDGYLARGLAVLREAAEPLGTVTVVAPDREQSATSHSLTLHHPLRAREAEAAVHVVDGTPTDCVIVAVNAVFDDPPDFCLSGINHGPNMGEDVLYSGTVAAAMEATVIGVPSVAISYSGDRVEGLEEWMPLVQGFLRQVVGQADFPASTLLNVNLPAVDPDQVKGIRVTSLGRRRYNESLTRALDPSGREYYWIGGGVMSWSGGEETDFHAVEQGYVSVTPLHLDLTNYRLLEEIRGWQLTL